MGFYVNEVYITSIEGQPPTEYGSSIHILYNRTYVPVKLNFYKLVGDDACYTQFVGTIITKGKHNPDSGRSDLEYSILRKVHTVIIVRTDSKKVLMEKISLRLFYFALLR